MNLKLALALFLAVIPVLAPAQSTSKAVDSLDIEFTMYDFIEKERDTMFQLNTFYLAANYTMFSPSQNFKVTFGPYLCENEYSNDLGLILNVSYYWLRTGVLDFYASVSGAGGIRLPNNKGYASSDLKLGGDIPLAGIHLIGEGGVCFRTYAESDIFVSAGIRVGIF